MFIKSSGKRSEKKKLRDEIGRLQLIALKKERGNSGRCEICNKPTDRLGRFHILRTSTHPRLEFVSHNILLTGWFCCHYPWHHNGANDPKSQRILKRIVEIRGKNYEDELLITEQCQPKHDKTYLKTLLYTYKTLANEGVSDKR